MSFRKSLVAGVGVVSLAAACGGQVGDEAQADAVQQPGSRFHVMKKMEPGTVVAESAPAGAHLNYYGGPVLKNVKVYPVYWNTNVAYRTNLDGFYTGVTNSTYFDMLGQYSGIGRGTRPSSYIDTKSTGTFTDAQVQAELTRLFNGNLLPKPDGNTYYPVHFPSGVTVVDSDGTASCTAWCAYHGTYKYNNVNVNYGIIPDQGGGCAGGCGSNSQRVNNLTSVSSHELVEAVTDPAVGLATTYSSPLAWYDPNYGEIGDICNAQQGSVVGGNGTTYVVQTEFSNSKNNCTVN
jgi:hypothetical protein